jgi:hypothetical protein
MKTLDLEKYKEIFDDYFNVPVAGTVQDDMVNTGESYTVSDTVACNATTVKWQVETPDTTKYSHWTFSLTATGEATFLVTEGSDRTTGTPLTAVNRNRLSSNTSGMTISRTPTGGSTDGATTLFSRRNGVTVGVTSFESGDASAERKWILAPNTKYVVSITTEANVYASFKSDWDEHTNV